MDFAVTEAIGKRIREAREQGYRPSKTAKTLVGQEVEIKSFPYSNGEDVMVLAKLVDGRNDWEEFKVIDLKIS